MVLETSQSYRLIAALLGAAVAGVATGGVVQPMAAGCLPEEKPVGTCFNYTCNRTTGMWSPAGTKVNGSPCNDNKACTTGDKCAAGTCKGTAVSNACCSSGVPITTNACCSAGAALTDAECNDGDACTTGERCTPSAVCQGGTPLAAINDNDQCTIDSCNPATGDIAHAPLPSIDDANQCTTDSCDTTTGAMAHVSRTGQSCTDGNACTTGETCNASDLCQGGTPLPSIDDLDQCTNDSCDPVGGGVSHTPRTGLSCDDGSACTTGETCDASSICQGGTPIAGIDDDNLCTSDSCDPITGVVRIPVSPGDSCSSGNLCRGPELCDGAGICREGPPPELDDGKDCTIDRCDPTLGVRHELLAVGTTCGPGDACTGGLTCDALGHCFAQAAPQIDDGDPCFVDSCDPATGVDHQPAPAGTQCSDGNPCNGMEACDGTGACKPGTPPSFDDGDLCTVDACDQVAGISHAPIYGCGESTCSPTQGTLFGYDASGNLTKVVSLADDVGNCGCQDNTCPGVTGGPAACRDGNCGTMYGNAFVRTSNDPDNCGGSGHVCPTPVGATRFCRNGTCSFVCAPGLVEAGDSCADLTADPWNCGFVANACDGTGSGGSTCEAGQCHSTGPLVVNTLNGIPQGGAGFRQPPWWGLTVTGANLSAVWSVVIEDLGPDATIQEPNLPRAPDLAGPTRNVEGGALGWGTSNVNASVPELITSRMLEPHRWYRVSLYGREADGTQSFTPIEVGVPVSFATFTESPPTAPAIVEVASIEELLAGSDYQADTGLISIPGEVLARWSAQGLVPQSLLCNDVLGTELPVRRVSAEGIYVQAGLWGQFNGHSTGDCTRFIGWQDTPSIVLVFPYRRPNGDRIRLGDGSAVHHWYLRGGAMLRGSGLYDAGGAPTLTVERPGGVLRPGTVSRNLAPDAMATCDAYFSCARYSFHGDRAIAWYVESMEEASAHLTFTSPWGSASTADVRYQAPWDGVPWELNWLNPPTVVSASSANVEYGPVMTLTGRFFIDVQQVLFRGFGEEPLARSPSRPPGPGRFYVVDDKTLELMLSPSGTAVPRGLAVFCSAMVPELEAGAGERTLTVVNSEGESSLPLFAVDPSLPRPPVPNITCPWARPSWSVSDSGGGSTQGPTAGTGGWPLIPQSPPGECINGTNVICPPP